MGDAVANVTALSDSESQGEALHQLQPASRKRKLGKQKSKTFAELVCDETGLRAMLGKPKCHCRKQCLTKFADDASFAELLDFRQVWASLHKLDQDTEALHRISKAIDGGGDAPRAKYLQKGVPKRWQNLESDNPRAQVVTFLKGVYESIAETLPDIRDEGRDDGMDVDERFSVSLPQCQADVDRYAEAMNDPKVRMKLKPRGRGIQVHRHGPWTPIEHSETAGTGLREALVATRLHAGLL
eukprot:s586_g22.t1